LLLLKTGIAAVTIEQFIHLSRSDFVSEKTRPPLTQHSLLKNVWRDTYASFVETFRCG
jgi:hypothetical protein